MRFLVVGLGSIGRRHVANARSLFPSSSIAVWRRTDTPALVPDESMFYDEVVTDLAGAIAFRPDVGVICVPTSLHVEKARALADAGVHLLIEKPISNTLDGVDSLIQTCKDRSLVLMVGYTLRFCEPLRVLKKLIDSEAIGRVLGLRVEVGQHISEWRPNTNHKTSVSTLEELGGGVLLELSHELDYVRWLTGEVQFVHASTQRHLGFDVEDSADIFIQSRKGVSCNIHLNMIQHSRTRNCSVVGTKGTLYCDILNNKILLYREGDSVPATVYDDPTLDKNIAYKRELQHFIECTRGTTQPLISGEEGRRVLEVALAAKKAAGSGCRIEI